MAAKSVATTNTLEEFRTTFNSLSSTDIGDLASLTTSANSIVGAINEVDAAIGTGNFTVSADSGSNTAIALGVDTLTVLGGSGLETALSGDTLTINDSASGVTAASYGSTTAIPVITVNNKGRITSATTAGITTTLSIRDSASTAGSIALATDELKFDGGAGLSASISGDVVTYNFDGVTFTNYEYTATTGQATFGGSDNNGNTLAYTAGKVDVFLNGVRLASSDYTATNGSTIALSSGAIGGDILVVKAFVTVNTSLIEIKFDTTPQLGGNLDLNSNDITGTGNINITGNLTISGDLTVNGTTTTINSTTISVDDKNIELGSVASPSDTTADGGGITLKGSTDHTFNWVNSTDAWTSSEHINLTSGKEYKINGTSLKDVTETLTNKTLTSPTITSGTVATSLDMNGTELVLDLDGDTSITADTDDQIDFKTGGTDRMTIDSSGNVGIGTTSPAQPLHVKALDARVRTEESTGSTIFELTNTSSGHFLDSTGTNDLTINKSGSANMVFKTANTERMTIDSSGNVGIGTSSPDHKLEVVDSTFTQIYIRGSGNVGGIRFGNTVHTNGHIYYDNGANMNFHTSGSERMRIDSSGNLKFDSGYGSVATAYGVRAWVMFNGTGTPSINGNGNVSSITDLGTGAYGINFATAMPSTAYSVVGIAQRSGTTNSDINVSERHNYSRTTSQVRIDVRIASSGGSSDPTRCNVMVVR